MKKFSKNLIPYYFIINIFYSVVFFLFIRTSFADEAGNVSNELTKISLLLSLIGYIILTSFSILYYYKTGYELKEHELVCKRGVLFKKESILEYSKIHAVNKKQGIIQRLFGLSTLTIDSGSTNTSSQSEIIIIELDEIVDELIKEIKFKQNNNIQYEELNAAEKENLYNFTGKSKLIYTALNCLGTFIITFILAIFIAIISKNFFENKQPWENGLNYLDFLLFVIGTGLIVVAGVAIGSVIVSFVQYHDFKIYKNGDTIEINYGLLTKQQNSFQLNRIKGIKISQGIIKRLFGFVTINLEVIGYTTQQNNQQSQTETIGVLIPLCRLSEINGYLEKILPDYLPLPKEEKTFKFLPFISYFMIFSSITLFILLLVETIMLGYYKLWTEMFMLTVCLVLGFGTLLLSILINQVFAYKNNGININEEKVTIYHGGLNKQITVILNKNVIAIEKITTYHRNKNGINSYKIHFKSNALTNTIKVCNLKIDVYEKLLNSMIY